MCYEYKDSDVEEVSQWSDRMVNFDKNLSHGHMGIYWYGDTPAGRSCMHSQTFTFTNQSILPQVCPHASPVPTSHENMVGEEIDARQRAGELSSARFVVVTYIGHHVIKFQHFVAFVLLS